MPFCGLTRSVILTFCGTPSSAPTANPSGALTRNVPSFAVASPATALNRRLLGAPLLGIISFNHFVPNVPSECRISSRTSRLPP